MKKRTSILLTGLITVGTLTPVLNVLATDQVLNDTTPKTGTVVDGDKTPGATDDTTNNDDQSVDQKDNGGLLDAPAIQKDTQKEKAPLVGANVSVSTPAELAAAVSAATSDTTITLSSSFPTSIPATTELKTTSTAKVTIDGGNKTLTPGGDFIMFNLRIFTGGSLTFQNINFDDSANLSNARALTVLDNTGTLNVDNAKFSNFSGYDDGAAIYFFGNTNITNSTFEGNSVFGNGYSGGALASKSTFGSFKLSNSKFIGNHTDALGTTVGGEGGAVYMFSPKAGASIEMTNNYFEGNTAVKDATSGNVKLADGGAVALFNVVDGNNINISGNTFNKNIAADDGGAMLIQTNSTITSGINIANNTFVGNEAYGRDLSVNSGGAIQLYANGAITAKQTALINFTNNTFVGNTAKYDGGAIGGFGYGLNYSAGAYKGNIFVNNTAQKNNVADRTTNVPGAGDLGNNIGYDNGTANTVDPTTVFGQFAPALVPNYSGIKAGTSKDAQVIPTIPVVPAKDADNKITDVLTSVSDQRSFGRALPSDIGATENKWVKYDSNGGTFELGADLASFDGSKYYEGASPTEYYQIGYVGYNAAVKTATDLKPTRDGYKFLGWSKDKDATTADFTAANITMSDDTTLYAVWEKPVSISTVNVKYVDEKDNELAPTDILTGTVGDTYTATAKKIDGWKLKESLTGAAAAKLLEKTTFAEVSDTVTGTFTNDPQNVKFVYTKVPTPPVDPTEPTKPTKPTTKTIVNTIVKKVLPKTGENNALNMALLASGVVLLSSVVGYAIYKNKKKVN